MTDVLITAGELAEFLKKEPCVIIDTRNPEAYGAGHLPGAVNVHEIFTYLATSTPEGIHELKTKFEQTPALKKAFEALTPGRQRAYLLHFSSPKQSSTRVARIDKATPKILAGKGLNDERRS